MDGCYWMAAGDSGYSWVVVDIIRMIVNKWYVICEAIYFNCNRKVTTTNR